MPTGDAACVACVVDMPGDDPHADDRRLCAVCRERVADDFVTLGCHWRHRVCAMPCFVDWIHQSGERATPRCPYCRSPRHSLEPLAPGNMRPIAYVNLIDASGLLPRVPSTAAAAASVTTVNMDVVTLARTPSPKA